MKHKIVMVMLSVTLIVSLILTGCVEPAAPPESAEEPAPGARYSFVMACDAYTVDYSYAALESFVEKVLEGSNGRIKIKMYPGAQLGNYDQVYPEVVMGSIDMMFGCVPGSYDTRCTITHFPYSVLSYEDATRLWGPGGEYEGIVKELTAEHGVKAFAAWGQGFGGYSLVNEPNNVADPHIRKGLKVRAPSTMRTFQECALALGYDIVPLPRAEVITALETGVIDGSVGSSAYLAYAHERDFINYYIWYHDHYAPWFLMMNLETFNSLSGEDQQLLQDAANEFLSVSFALSEAFDRECLDKLADYGVEVIELTDEEIENIADWVRKEAWPKLESDVGKDILDKLKKGVGLES